MDPHIQYIELYLGIHPYGSPSFVEVAINTVTPLTSAGRSLYDNRREYISLAI